VHTTVASNTEVTFMNLTSDTLTLLKSVLNPDGPQAYTTIFDAAQQASKAASDALTALRKAIQQAEQDATAAKSKADDANTSAGSITNGPTGETAVTKAQDAYDAQKTAEVSAAAALANLAAYNQAAAASSAATLLLDTVENLVKTSVANQATAAAAAANNAMTAVSNLLSTNSPDKLALADQIKLQQLMYTAATMAAAAEAAFEQVGINVATAAGSQTVMAPDIPTPPVPGGPTAIPSKINIFDLALNLQYAVVPNLSDPIALQAKRKSVHNALVTAFPDYAKTIQAIVDFINIQPVAPAMAGVYTAIDSSRGVWKAPANVGLSAVTKPTLNLSDRTQADLNVDAATGKSINAIRYFRGMGTQVWGARTLEGNSDDWRYVNVRRTLIMIEQSVKLAVRAYVFEANDANTWVTVQSMIGSFLLNLWKQGALYGTVPAEAYTVSVGQGVTMTADDVLQGIMRVLVKVSLVRPAEFILLTFEQQMPGM